MVEHIGLHGALEGTDLEDLKLHPELLQETGVEGDLRAQTRQRHHRLRTGVDLVCHGGDVVIAEGKGLAVSVDRLASFLEAQQRITDRLRGVEAHKALVQSQHDGIHLRIGPRLLDRSDDLGESVALLAIVTTQGSDRGEGVVHGSVGDLAYRVEQQDTAGGEGHLCLGLIALDQVGDTADHRPEDEHREDDDYHIGQHKSQTGCAHHFEEIFHCRSCI